MTKTILMNGQKQAPSKKPVPAATYKKLLGIAKESIPAIERRGDLERQWRDSDDFIETSVWSLEELLLKAYALGKADGEQATQKKPATATVIKESVISGHTIIINKEESGWQIGTINGLEFNALAFEEPSKFGINNGNVSKLYIKGVLNYDRGWDKRPETADGKAMLKAVLQYYKDPANCKR